MTFLWYEPEIKKKEPVEIFFYNKCEHLPFIPKSIKFLDPEKSLSGFHYLNFSNMMTPPSSSKKLVFLIVFVFPFFF